MSYLTCPEGSRRLNLWYFTCLEGSKRLDLSYFTCLEGSKRLDLSYFTCLEGSGRLNVSYFTCLEAQNVDKYVTFARFWEAQDGSVTLTPVVNPWFLGPPRYLGT